MRWLVAIVALTLLALAVWGACGVTHHLIVAIDAWGDVGAQANHQLSALRSRGGTLTMLDEDIGAAKSAIIHLDLVARHEQQSLGTMDRNVDQTFADLHGTLQAAQQTLASASRTEDALTQTASSATQTLDASTHALAATTPLIQQTQSAVASFSTAFPAIAQAAQGAAATSQQAALIATDTRKVADHFEQEIDNPKKRPWYIRILPGAMQAGFQAVLTRWAVQGLP